MERVVTVANKLIAIIFCAVFLVLVFGLFVFIQMGGYSRALLGENLTDLDPLLPFTADYYHLSAIVGVLLTLFLGSDIHALFTENEQKLLIGQSKAARPFDRPLGYAGVRLRRYLLIPLVFSYAILANYWLSLVMGFDQEQEKLRFYQLAVLAVVFIIARRPLSFSPQGCFTEFLQIVGSFCAGVSGR